MFASVEETLKSEFDEYYESQHPVEVVLEETGDHAIEWSFFFYTKEIKQLLKIKQIFRELILNQALTDEISLATPLTHSIDKTET